MAHESRYRLGRPAFDFPWGAMDGMFTRARTTYKVTVVVTTTLFAPLFPSHRQPQFPGLSTHITTYYTMGTPLVKELALALRCFVSSLIEKTQDGTNDLDGSSCEEVR